MVYIFIILQLNNNYMITTIYPNRPHAHTDQWIAVLDGTNSRIAKILHEPQFDLINGCWGAPVKFADESTAKAHWVQDSKLWIKIN